MKEFKIENAVYPYFVVLDANGGKDVFCFPDLFDAGGNVVCCFDLVGKSRGVRVG